MSAAEGEISPVVAVAVAVVVVVVVCDIAKKKLCNDGVGSIAARRKV